MCLKATLVILVAVTMTLLVDARHNRPRPKHFKPWPAGSRRLNNRHSSPDTSSQPDLAADVLEVYEDGTTAYSSTTTTTAATSTTSTVAATTKTTTEPPEEDPNSVVVSLGSGHIRGKYIDVEDGDTTKQISTFLGVRFAEAPLGQKRFKPPEKARPWDGIQDATSYKPNCYQWTDNTFLGPDGKTFEGVQMWNSNSNVSEDCLFLNIWTPVTDFQRTLRNYNVMVWIYGGGFYSGSSSLDVYDGKWLAATEKVVVVSINYRVAGLGFLFYDDDKVAGNAGLYDQRMALQWVQDNIVQFGGDPNSVTIFGESAGGASTSYHVTSPKSRHLFKNAIIQSGSLLSPWAMISKKEAKRRAELLANRLNCSNEYSVKDGNETEEEKKEATIKCFQNAPAKRFVDEEINTFGDYDYGTFRFANAPIPSEDFLAHDPKVVPPKVPDNVDVMVGYNANEGTYFLAYSSPGWNPFSEIEGKIDYSNFTEGLKKSMKNPLGDLYPVDDEYNIRLTDLMSNYTEYVYTRGTTPESLQKVSACPRAEGEPCVQESHTYTQIMSETFYRTQLDDMTGDVAVVCPLLQFANNVKTGTEHPGKVFFYHFIQRSSQNPWPEWMGVMHGYEIEFVFGLPLDVNRNYTAEERSLSRGMMRMWANFAKHGDPNGDEISTKDSSDSTEVWKEYNLDKQCINVIGKNSDPVSMSSFLNPRYSALQEHCSYWNDFFPRLYQLAVSGRPGRTDQSPPSPPPQTSDPKHETSSSFAPKQPTMVPSPSTGNGASTLKSPPHLATALLLVLQAVVYLACS